MFVIYGYFYIKNSYITYVFRIRDSKKDEGFYAKWKIKDALICLSLSLTIVILVALLTQDVTAYIKARTQNIRNKVNDILEKDSFI